ncbi:hypothetical protein FE410_05210 [Leuconostoc carnosum]|uniref:hypothetical protein n=2 Tax=Lactobacillaceae TaxID=33958 RepID=UPI00123AA0E2|nr:hypothetical protein [Leuconostoc carnosum]KAA8371089.1 hypothetical protein FE414_05205 [Leuconostoc carnosum]KAA8382730.1 hypothetical protein FE410_05210 [Leuconostoc carnosum]
MSIVLIDHEKHSVRAESVSPVTKSEDEVYQVIEEYNDGIHAPSLLSKVELIEAIELNDGYKQTAFFETIVGSRGYIKGKESAEIIAKILGANF